MQVTSTALPDVKLIRPVRHADARGFFMETYSLPVLGEHGIVQPFVQDNHSMSRQPGTVRGLHFQAPPFAQGKLVRVVKGSIFDVAVDIRLGSPTFGRHIAATLTAEGGEQLWVPEGFAHGFCTLEPDTEVIYKVTAVYSRNHDHAIRWDDAELGIAWPVAADAAQLSDKDRAAPSFAQLQTPFRAMKLSA